MQPKTTNEFLDAISAKAGGASDYRLAQLLGCSKQIISSYRHKGVAFGDEIAIRAAGILGLDPAYVVMCVHRERAKTEAEKALWASMLERLGGLAASILVVAVLIAPPPVQAGAMPSSHIPSGHPWEFLFSESKEMNPAHPFLSPIKPLNQPRPAQAAA